jgi:hypothetical protein
MLLKARFNLPPKSPIWGTFRHNKPPIWGVGGLPPDLMVWGLYLLMPLFIIGCGKKSGNHLFTLMPSSVTHADFINKLDYETQLKKKFNVYTFRNFYNGGGELLAILTMMVLSISS